MGLSSSPAGCADAFRTEDRWGFPKIGDPKCSTLNSRILIIYKDPKIRHPQFSETPRWVSRV